MKKIILFLHLSISLVFGNSIEDLNKKGVLALQNKDYKKAEEYFKKILSNSPNHPKANYNLACTYSLMKNSCELELEDAFIFLERAIQYDSFYKKRMLNDSDLNSLKNSVKFYTLAGFSKKQILTKIIWYGPKPGVAEIDKIIFYKDNTFKYYLFNSSGEGNPVYREYSGTYQWKAENLEIQFKNTSPFDLEKKTLKVIMKENSLKIDGIDHELTDFEDRCGS